MGKLKVIKYTRLEDIPEDKIREFISLYLMYGYAFLNGKDFNMTDECYEWFYDYVKYLASKIRKE